MVVPLKELDFNVLADHYHPALMNYAMKMCDGNYTFAEEAVQETLIKAWTHRESVRTNFNAWIYQILNRKIHDAYRVERSANYFMKRLPVGYDKADSKSMYSETHDRIIDAINSLPEHYREVSRLTLVEELEQQEIADKLNIPLGTVQSKQSRSKAILKDKLKDLNNG